MAQREFKSESKCHDGEEFAAFYDKRRSVGSLSSAS